MICLSRSRDGGKEKANRRNRPTTDDYESSPSGGWRLVYNVLGIESESTSEERVNRYTGGEDGA